MSILGIWMPCFLEHAIEHQHLALGLVADPLGGRLAQVLDRHLVVLEHRREVVFHRALAARHHHGVVLRRDQVARNIVAVGLHLLDHAVHLPGRRGAGRHVDVPGNVDPQAGLGAERQGLAVARHVHQAAVVLDHGLG
jgi:hypothetical protein